MTSADEIAASIARGKLKEIQCILGARGEAVPPSVLEKTDLSREVIETKRNNAKVTDRNNDLVTELDESRAFKRLASDMVQKAEARVKALEEHVKALDSKYSKTVEDAAQVEKKLRMHLTLLELELKTERDPIIRFEEDRLDGHGEDRDVIFKRQKAPGT